jgi:molybdopterin converting factor small subunit
MRLLVNIFGPEVKVRQEIWLEPASPSLGHVLEALREKSREPLERFLKGDLSPADGAAILVNGRNILSLDTIATTIRDGDELTFTVMVAGG